MSEDIPVAGTKQSVLVVGAGLAGLASAAALAPRGFRVTVLESRTRLGGRASSFREASTGQLVDACQHVSMGCCTNFMHFCRTVGIDHFLAPQKTLYFMTPDGRISRFKADPLPVPLHLARSFARAHFLTAGDKLRIGWGMACLLRADPEDDQPLLPWLKKNRQNEQTINRFWSIVLVSALNERMDRLGLKYARKVFRDGFIRHRRGFEVSVPTVPLARLYGEEMRAWLDKHGVAIETNAGVAGLDFAQAKVMGARLRDGRQVQADWYIVTTPFERLLELLPPAIIDKDSYFADMRRLTVSPITSVHLWYDRPILTLPHVVLIDCLGQWVFNRDAHSPGEQYLQVVISAARDLKGMGHDQVLRTIIAELSSLFPEAANAPIVRSKVITEHAATFSAVPGVDRWRPTQASPVSNLIVGGDWTRTGWPATMEGAVRSGYLAAEAILRKVGRPERILQPDL